MLEFVVLRSISIDDGQSLNGDPNGAVHHSTSSNRMSDILRDASDRCVRRYDENRTTACAIGYSGTYGTLLRIPVFWDLTKVVATFSRNYAPRNTSA